MLQRQHLFSVYLHPLPDFGTFPEESIFHGREIQERIQVCFLIHYLNLYFIWHDLPERTSVSEQPANCCCDLHCAAYYSSSYTKPCRQTHVTVLCAVTGVLGSA